MKNEAVYELIKHACHKCKEMTCLYDLRQDFCFTNVLKEQY